MARGDYLARTKGGIENAIPRPGGGSGDGFWNTVGGVAENIYAGNLADQNVANNQNTLQTQIDAAQGGNITGGDVESYFDPVTTTTILQGLFAIVAAIILYIRNPKQIIIDLKNLFSKTKDVEVVDKNNPEKKD